MEDTRHNFRARAAPAALFLLGMNGIVTQAILLREFLTVFHGNEMTIGIILANWMLLTGAGAFAGGRIRRANRGEGILFLLLFLNGFLPLLIAFLLPFLRSLLFPPGVMIGLIECFYGSALLLLPFCIAAGMLFPLLVPFVREEKGDALPRSYAVESIGGIAGGILLTVALLFLLPAFTILLLQFLATGIFLLLASRSRRSAGGSVAIALLLLVAAGAVLILRPDERSRQYLHPGRRIAAWMDTPYGSLAATRSGSQADFFENNSLLFSTGDVTANEEAVHFALSQRSAPARVLLLSGGVAGLIPEIEKHAVRRIDYVEINPALIGMAREMGIYAPGSRMRLFLTDGRRYAERTGERYDAALVNAPDPSTAQLNRYFSTEFFSRLKERLAPDGVVSISLASSGEYQGEDARRLHSILFNTLRASFGRVIVVPGERNYYLASDSALTLDIARNLAERGISTQYVNADYLQEDLLAARSAELADNVDPGAPVNRDFAPAAYFEQLLLWMSFFEGSAWMILPLILLLLFPGVRRMSAAGFALFAGGFAGASIEVMLILGFQILCGYLYQAVGALVAAFMAGLAAGVAIARAKKFPARIDRLDRFLPLFGLLALFVPFLLEAAARIRQDLFTSAAVGILMLAAGAAGGMTFAFASRIHTAPARTRAGELYGADLAGAALGAFAASVYLIPRFGFEAAGRAACGICLLGSIVVFAARAMEARRKERIA